MVYLLDDYVPVFPDPRLGDPTGLLAVGGALTTDWLIEAYSQGIFPWFAYKLDEPHWYCPMDRFVIFPEEIHVSHSMRTLINKNQYQVTVNRDFEGVIRGCSTVDERSINICSWLGEDMIRAYCGLHKMGYAASVEVWDGEALVGGLYGVTMGKCFMGESMFSLVPSASKLALIALANTMKEGGCHGFIDCQFETPHLKSMGGRHISYDEYLQILSGE